MSKTARTLALAVAVASALAVAACNTLSGVGQDVQAAGRAVTGAAEDMKR